jgi:hypothetical protein
VKTIYRRAHIILILNASLLVIGCSNDGTASEESEEQSDPDESTDAETTDAETTDDETTDAESTDAESTDDEMPASEATRPAGAEGKQGIFATLNGESLQATRAGLGSDGFVQEATASGSQIILEAKEVVGDDEIDWSLWLPKSPGTYACGLHTNPSVAHIAIENIPNGRSGANSGISAEDCVVTVLRLDPEGIIEGSFSGTLGGLLGSAQVVTDGWFYVDNASGGGDCSEAADPGVAEGDYGATVSITRLEIVGTSAPKYLRCGQNLRLDALYAGQSNVRAGAGGRPDLAPTVTFSKQNAYLDAVTVNLQLGGLDRSDGNNLNCAIAFFDDFSLERAEDQCVVTLTQFDDELWTGSYAASLSYTRDGDTSLLEIMGSFRMPPVFNAGQ